MAAEWHIGVIGGSGLAAGIGLEDAQQLDIASPFGAPSGPVTQGLLGGVRISFLPRHGSQHAIPPGAVNYRANVDALKRCGVTDLVAISAVGSLRENIPPGHMIAVDQFIDRTVARPASFFGPGLVAHVGLADPVCHRLSGLLADAAGAAGAPVHRGGCYIAIEGPQFSTRAESRLYRTWGADVIGMTAMPEVRLAREAELPYALLATATDYDAWRSDQTGVEADEVFAVMAQHTERAREALRHFAAALPETREPSPIDRTLDHALATPRADRDPVLVAKLDAVAGRVLLAARDHGFPAPEGA